MKKFDNPLLGIQIASPCSADWDSMSGDNRKRFCGDCNLNVYNLSGMTKSEAENLLIESEGKVCVRLYRRPDGSVITKDCPVGFAKATQRVKLVVSAGVSLVFTFFGALGIQAFFGSPISLSAKFPKIFSTPTPQKLIEEVAAPSPTPRKTATPKPTPEPIILMGKPVAPKSTETNEKIKINEPRMG